MPRLGKTIIPRIRRSLANRGLLRTFWRSLLGPYHLLTEYRKVRRNYSRPDVPDEFDLVHDVETTRRVHLSDLAIDSPNWIHGVGYWPTSADLFEEALAGLDIRFEEFVFVDFGSGKGRALLMASELPFRRIIGVEFSPALHAIARQNIRRYRSSTQKCRDVTSVCMDFTQFPIPQDPLFAFLYNPSSRQVMTALVRNLAESLQLQPREMWVLYVTPTYDVFEGGSTLLRRVKSSEKYAVFTNLNSVSLSQYLSA